MPLYVGLALPRLPFTLSPCPVLDSYRSPKEIGDVIDLSDLTSRCVTDIKLDTSPLLGKRDSTQSINSLASSSDGTTSVSRCGRILTLVARQLILSLFFHRLPVYGENWTLMKRALGDILSIGEAMCRAQSL